MTWTRHTRGLRALAFAGVAWLGTALPGYAAYVEYTSSVTSREVTGSGWLTQPVSVAVQEYDPATHGGLPLLRIDFYLHAYFDGPGGSLISFSTLDSGEVSVTSISMAATIYADWSPFSVDDMNTMPAHSTASVSFTGSTSWAVSNQATTTKIGDLVNDGDKFTGSSTEEVRLRASALTFNYTPQVGKTITPTDVAYMGADLTVRYFYGEIPEPTALFLLGGGAALLARRRRWR